MVCGSDNLGCQEMSLLCRLVQNSAPSVITTLVNRGIPEMLQSSSFTMKGKPLSVIIAIETKKEV